MFEEYQFAGVYIAIQAVLTLYAQGNDNYLANNSFLFDQVANLGRATELLVHMHAYRPLWLHVMCLEQESCH